MGQVKIVLLAGGVVLGLLVVLTAASVADYFSHPEVANVAVRPETGVTPLTQDSPSPLPSMLPLPAPGTAPTAAPSAAPAASAAQRRQTFDQLVQQFLRDHRHGHGGN